MVNIFNSTFVSEKLVHLTANLFSHNVLMRHAIILYTLKGGLLESFFQRDLHYGMQPSVLHIFNFRLWLNA